MVQLGESSSSSSHVEIKAKEFHIAPMLDVSTQEFCHFMRILTKRAILWTEMVVDSTILHTKHLDHHLPYSPDLSPIVCQIGGRDARSCGEATRVVERYGYDEVNLNIDCPSSRVSGERKFGAVLMHDCEAAYSVVEAMHANVQDIPISVKCRIGIELDDGVVLDTFDHLVGFIGELRDRGCRKFVIHARKCVIGGLSPAQNRIVPPLNYPRVYDLCHCFPDCEFIINAGIPGLASARRICLGQNYCIGGDNCNNNNGNDHDDGNGDFDEKKDENQNCDHGDHSVPCAICNASNGSCITPPTIAPPNLTGCMVGRACREHPAMFWDVDRYFYGEQSNPCHNRREALEKYCLFLEKCYPRRCCDNDSRKTGRIPAPKVTMFTEGGCPICQEFYGTGRSCSDAEDEGEDTATNHMQEVLEVMFQEQASKEKITLAGIGRCLTPIRGLFFGLHGGSKHFKLQCDTLAKDRTVRNCGPGYIVRKAMSMMPDEMLDAPFVNTEDLNEADVPIHVSPSTCHLGKT